ncbi:MAG: M24 family metallopeptidase [Rhodospirillales bacterium]
MEFSTPPADLHTVRAYRLGRLREQLRAADAAGGLFFNQINTRYATDATNMQVWCAHYETRCCFVSADPGGPVVLFDYADHPHLAEDLPLIDEYRVMPSFYFFTAGDNYEHRLKNFCDQIEDLVRSAGGGANMRLAVDHLSVIGAEALRARGVQLIDGEGPAERARCIKSAEELALMRVSMDVCQQGMDAMRAVMAPGVTENAMLAQLHETNVRMGGEWIETRLLSSGPRTNPWFREASMRAMEPGEIVSFDTDLIGPYGYCSDISRAWISSGRPSDEQRRLYAKAYGQIQHNIEILKPGMTFRDHAEKQWPIPEEFLSRRYTSCVHGVGLADEYPSIKHAADFDAKGYDGVIEPGMVLCVESFIGAHGGREGVKLEEQVIITETGAAPMSTYRYETDWL